MVYNICIEDDLDKSLVAHSEFVPFTHNPMAESLVTTSEKVYFQNASQVNRQEYENDKKYLPSVGEHEEESQNQFLEVGKWKKSQESTLNKDMQTVKQQVDERLTLTRSKEKGRPQSEEVIADESIVPDEKDDGDGEDEIEDQTQRENKEENNEEDEDEDEEADDEEEEESSSQEEQEQDEEEEDEEETPQQSQEPSGQEQQQQQQQETQSPLTVQQKPEYHPQEYSKVRKEELVRSSSERSKANSTHFSEDDRTDAHSEMKTTGYLPGKWTKKMESSGPGDEVWRRKKAILLRIAGLVE